MAQITKAIQDWQPLVANLIPPATVAKMTQDQLLDRMAHVADLNARAARASNPLLANCFHLIAKAVVTAAPPDEVKQKARGYRAKAALLGPGFGDHLLRMAEDLERHNPAAPRRAAVRKAQAQPVLMPVYDVMGKLIGVMDEAELTLVADPDVISKAAAAGMTAVFDDQGKAVGFTHRDAVGPVGGVTVSAGGTTGLGQPRNAPQQRLPGDVPGRQVVKSARRPGR